MAGGRSLTCSAVSISSFWTLLFTISRAGPPPGGSPGIPALRSRPSAGRPPSFSCASAGTVIRAARPRAKTDCWKACMSKSPVSGKWEPSVCLSLTLIAPNFPIQRRIDELRGVQAKNHKILPYLPARVTGDSHLLGFQQDRGQPVKTPDTPWAGHGHALGGRLLELDENDQAVVLNHPVTSRFDLDIIWRRVLLVVAPQLRFLLHDNAQVVVVIRTHLRPLRKPGEVSGKNRIGILQGEQVLGHGALVGIGADHHFHVRQRLVMVDAEEVTRRAVGALLLNHPPARFKFDMAEIPLGLGSDGRHLVPLLVGRCDLLGVLNLCCSRQLPFQLHEANRLSAGENIRQGLLESLAFFGNAPLGRIGRGTRRVERLAGRLGSGTRLTWLGRYAGLAARVNRINDVANLALLLRIELQLRLNFRAQYKQGVSKRDTFGLFWLVRLCVWAWISRFGLCDLVVFSLWERRLAWTTTPGQGRAAIPQEHGGEKQSTDAFQLRRQQGMGESLNERKRSGRSEYRYRLPRRER